MRDKQTITASNPASDPASNPPEADEPVYSLIPPMSAYGLPVRPEVAAIMPDRVKQLPVCKDRGYPVPAFVPWIDGKAEFRVVTREAKERAISKSICWVCGQKLGRYRAFVIGPMCALNRISADLPSHADCAEFSCRACPFLINPNMTRRRNDELGGIISSHSAAIDRNPGVTLLWVTETYRVFRSESDLLVRIGNPVNTKWFREGREATRAEVMESVNSGLALISSNCSQSDIKEIESKFPELEKLLPEN